LGAKRKLFKITYGTSQTPFYPGPDLEGYQLRDEASHYKALFGIKNDDIGIQNTYSWDINV
jgi:hypothetical protein